MEEMVQDFGMKDKVLAYYRSSMPYCDKTDVPAGVLEAFADHACFLRERVAWCRELPEDIFLENVAAYRINSERIEDCRRLFYDMVMPKLEGLTQKEAVLRVNLWCAQNATYHQADYRTANAVTVYKSGFGRCGEESTFAVTILRSVGLAARQVYAPLWSHCDDNHAWVEVYCDGRWQYLGACEPEPVLNRGWFDLPASKAMLVHARAFGLLDGQDDVIARNGSVVYYNVTGHYAKTADVVFALEDADGRPFADAQVQLSVLNYAHFGTIATLRTDGAGKAALRLGLGSVRISGMQNGRVVNGFFTVAQSGTFTVRLQETCMDEWQEGRFIAPKGGVAPSEEADPEVFVAFQKELEEAKKMRENRIASYYDADRAGHFAEAQEILRTAGGNFGEVIRFLETDENAYRLPLLQSLTQKDYYDLKADVLEDHLACAMPFAQKEDVPEDIFVKYLLNPRVEYEELSTWRRQIREILGERAGWYVQNPPAIWTEICEKVRLPKGDGYDTLRMQPLSVLQGMRGSLQDQKNLFVAVARSCGIPARLHPVTGEAEFYQNHDFHPAKGDKEEGSRTWLRILAKGGKGFGYMTDWCLERLEENGYHAMHLHDAQWAGEELAIQASPGTYRVTTTVRLLNGDQLFRECCFVLGEQEKTVELARHSAYLDADEGTKLPVLSVHTPEGSDTLDGLRKGGRVICAWIREGEEPTEHILNEMLEHISDVKNCCERIFLFGMQPPKTDGTLSRLLEAVPGIRFLQAGDFDAALQAAEAMGTEAGKYPLALVVDEDGRGIYATCGYNVGAVAQMLMRM